MTDRGWPPILDNPNLAPLVREHVHAPRVDEARMGAYAYRSVVQALTTATWSTIVFDTELHDTPTGVYTGGLFTIPAGGGGLWVIGGSLTFAANAVGNYRLIDVVRDPAGTPNFLASQGPTQHVDAARFEHLTTSIILPVSAGEVFAIQGYQDTGGNLNTGAASAASPRNACGWAWRIGL